MVPGRSEDNMLISRTGAFTAKLLAGAAFALAASGPSWAAWPDRPIKVIVPIGAGSAADVVPRLVFERVSAAIGQPIIIENRPGAGGTLGAAAVAKADADGYTLLAMSSSFTIAPAVYKALPYNSQQDLLPVIPLGSIPNSLVVAPSKGWSSVQELVAAGRAKPGTLNYGSVGNGTAMHLNAERFRLSAAFDAQHVAFKSAPEVLTEVMTGRIDFSFIPISTALPFIQEGKLRALAVGSSHRASSLGDVPTTIQAGLSNSDYNFWLGVFAPARTPKEVVSRLYQETNKALQLPAVKEALGKLGVEPMTMDGEQFAAHVQQEIGANAELVQAAGIVIK